MLANWQTIKMTKEPNRLVCRDVTALPQRACERGRLGKCALSQQCRGKLLAAERERESEPAESANFAANRLTLSRARALFLLTLSLSLWLCDQKASPRSLSRSITL